MALILAALIGMASPVSAGTSAQQSADAATPLLGDALLPPQPPSTASVATDPTPGLYQPSAFLAGKVAVRLIFVESNGHYEPSVKNWSPTQLTDVQNQVSAALSWWAAQLPNAHLQFDLTSQVVPSGYEPVLHGLSTESQWVGDAFTSMGIAASNYFDQAYAADEALRRERGADWAANIFVANSAGTPDGRFADGHFAYAYINGPFMVITSDVGPYGIRQMAPVVAHEFGHIFGALDQYAAAGVSCTQKSGYLSVPNTNSQANNCGTHFPSIMIEPLSAYSGNQVDQSAFGQLGYRDSDSDGIPDPLDTAPQLQIQLSQSSPGTRPLISGSAVDQAYASPAGELASINSITRVEYRIDGGAWLALAPADGAYNTVAEQINATMPLYNGQHAVELRAFNRIGAISPVVRYENISVSGVGDNPGYQITAPKVTNATTVNLTIAAPAGSMIQLSENAYFSGAAWAAAQPSASMQIGATEGAHTIYARFRDPKGLESAPFSVAVTLDRTPPIGRALLKRDHGTLWLEIQAADGQTQVTAMQIDAAPSGSGVWQPFQAKIVVSLQSDTLFVRLRDEAGNASQPVQALPASPIWLPVAAT